MVFKYNVIFNRRVGEDICMVFKYNVIFNRGVGRIYVWCSSIM